MENHKGFLFTAIDKINEYGIIMARVKRRGILSIQYSKRGSKMEKKGRKMAATMEVTTQEEEIETKLGRLKRMKEDGRLIEASQLQAELAIQGFWVSDDL